MLFLLWFWIVIGIGAVRWFVWSGGRGGVERERGGAGGFLCCCWC